MNHVSALVCTVLSAAYVGMLAGGCANDPAGQSTRPAVTEARAISGPKDIAENWGIEIVGIKLSAAGYVLDFRYRVLDPEKARPILERKAIRYLVDQDTGAKMLVPSSPKTGPMRQTTLKPEVGRVYFIVFSNPRGLVKAGEKVTVVIGDFRAQDLVVK